MAGEIGVIFNVPQPFTVRSRRLSQVIRISHQHFKQLVQPHVQDGRIIISNFAQYLKTLKAELLEEMPFVTELPGGLNNMPDLSDDMDNHEDSAPNCDGDANTEGSSATSTRPCLPIRLVIHGYHPDDANNMKDSTIGKLIHLPGSIEELLTLAEGKFGRKGSKVFISDGSEVDDLNTLRDNEDIFIC